jgi:glyoxylase-like metal-dependent hydrolase (beta-lactamase superfamily II)
MKSINWAIGKVKIIQIVELEAGDIIQEILPNATPDIIKKISWLQPHFADKKGKLKALVQSFIIDTGDKIILIDTCIGNNKNRKDIPSWGNLQTKFLDHMKNIGYQPKDINIVLCTHLHFDHVGWNTKLENGVWVPTFPNARYLFAEEEYNYWKEKPGSEIEDDHNGIEDSVKPIVELGLSDLVPVNYFITNEISIFPTFGHTPSHVSVLIISDGVQAVITGDCIHHPCQIAYPDWSTLADSNQEQARHSREDFLKRFADTNTLIIGSHFAYPTAGYIEKKDDRFKLIV